MLITEQRTGTPTPSGTQADGKSKELGSKDLLTVSKAAAVLRIKEGTVRAWILNGRPHM
jgi:hypothetical protein